MNSKPIIIAIFLTVISLFILSATIFQKSSLTPLSPNTAYLTQPVTSFSGTITQVDKNTITVAEEKQIIQSSTDTTTPFPNKTLSYKINLTPKTLYNRMILPIDYQQKTGIFPQGNSFSASDLKKGQLVTVISDSDLRFLKENAFTALTVELPPLQRLVSGKLETIKNGEITISSLASSPETPLVPLNQTGREQWQKFTISIPPSTKIMRMNTPANPSEQIKPEPVTLESIPLGTEVYVYLKKSVDEVPLDAAYLEYTVYPSPTPVVQNANPSAPQTLPITQTPAQPTP